MSGEKTEATVKQRLVVLAVNDLESVKIYELLKEKNIPMLAYNYAWGEEIIYDKADIQKLNLPYDKITEIFLVERKQKEDISVLKELFSKIKPKYLDHHSYADEPKPEKKDKEGDNGKDIFQKSALEQIIDHFPELKECQNTSDIKKIVANDKDFIPGLVNVIFDEKKIFENNEELLQQLWAIIDNELDFYLEEGKFRANENLNISLLAHKDQISDFIKEFENANYDQLINEIRSFRKTETLIQYKFQNTPERKTKPALVTEEQIAEGKNDCPDFAAMTEEVRTFVSKAEEQRNMRRFSTNRVRDNRAPELTLIRYPSHYSFCIGDQLYLYEKEQQKEKFLTFCLSDFYEIDSKKSQQSQDMSQSHKVYWRKKSLRDLCDHINQRVRDFYGNYTPYLGVTYDGSVEKHSQNPIYEDCHTGVIYSGKISNENKKNNLRKKADEICLAEKGLNSYGSRNFYGVGFDLEKKELDKIQSPLNNIIDHHLNQLLIDNRPLKAWRTSFFQPLAYTDNIKRADLKNIGECYEAYKPNKQERAFFLSYLRKLIDPDPDQTGDGTGFDSEKDLGKAVIESYLYKQDHDNPTFYAHLEYPHAENTIKLPITRILVHFFYNETVIIEWQYEQTAACADKDRSSLTLNAYWKRLLAGDYQDEATRAGRMLSPAQVIDINEKLRFAYSTFITQDMEPSFNLSLYQNDKLEGDTLHFGQKIHITDNDRQQDGCDDFDGFFRALASRVLEPFGFQIAEKTDSITFLGDDRARVVSSMVFSGNQPENILPKDESWKFLDSELDVLFSRFRVVDSYNQDYFSDQDFEKLDRKGRVYDRYKNKGSLYGITDHSFVFMGFGDFSLEEIHGKHMNTIYRRMFLVAQFYVTILHKFSKDVSKNARNGISFLELRKELNIFTNGFWFEQISSQVQGKELFSMMRQNSSMENDYELIHSEIARMDELEAARSTRLNQRFELVVAITGIIGIGYFLLSLFNDLWSYPDYLDTEISVAVNIISQDAIYWLSPLLILYILGAILLYTIGFNDKIKRQLTKKNKYNKWVLALLSPLIWLWGKVKKRFTR